MKFQKDNTK